MMVNPVPRCPACGAAVFFGDEHACLTTVPDRTVLRVEEKSAWDEPMPWQFKTGGSFSGKITHYNAGFFTNISAT